MRYLDDDGTPVTVNRSNVRREGIRWPLRQSSEHIYASQHVIVRLFRSDFGAQFLRSIPDHYWALLGTFLEIVSFLSLFFIGVLRQGGRRGRHLTASPFVGEFVRSNQSVICRLPVDVQLNANALALLFGRSILICALPQQHEHPARPGS